MELPFKCWHCRGIMVLKHVGSEYWIECTRADHVCGLEGCGPKESTVELATISYYNMVAVHLETIANGKITVNNIQQTNEEGVQT